MNKKYLVAYIIRYINPNSSHLKREKDKYKVFTDYENNQLAAQIFYERLLVKDDTYSANICEIIESTDY